MLFHSPLHLYADKNNWNVLKTIQLQWEGRGADLDQLFIFKTEKPGKIKNVNILLQWLHQSLPFEANAMSRLMSARDEQGGNLFSESFINFLQRFRFAGTFWAVADETWILAGQPILQIQSSALHAAILQLWVTHLIKPAIYLVSSDELLQVRRFYDKDGKIIQDTIFSPDTPPIVNFEAASWEDLLQLVFPAGQQSSF